MLLETDLNPKDAVLANFLKGYAVVQQASSSITTRNDCFLCEECRLNCAATMSLHQGSLQAKRTMPKNIYKSCILLGIYGSCKQQRAIGLLALAKTIILRSAKSS